MIKKVWDAIHFGRFRSQWRTPQDLTTDAQSVRISQTLFYENRLEKTENGWELITETGGVLGRHAFYIMLVVYASFGWALVTGQMSVLHVALFEAAFIGVFGLLNGYALHRMTLEPDFGLESLSLRRISTH